MYRTLSIHHRLRLSAHLSLPICGPTPYLHHQQSHTPLVQQLRIAKRKMKKMTAEVTSATSEQRAFIPSRRIPHCQIRKNSGSCEEMSRTVL
jgi:hypothetical protein